MIVDEKKNNWNPIIIHLNYSYNLLLNFYWMDVLFSFKLSCMIIFNAIIIHILIIIREIVKKNNVVLL